jgi:hypothetical protein
VAFIPIYNSDHPLGAGVNMDVFDHDRLAVPPPAPIEGLEQVILEFDQFVGVSLLHLLFNTNRKGRCGGSEAGLISAIARP